jgi:hypothetical protein
VQKDLLESLACKDRLDPREQQARLDLKEILDLRVYKVTVEFTTYS